MNIPGSDAAFPQPFQVDSYGSVTGAACFQMGGLTKRELFAAMAPEAHVEEVLGGTASSCAEFLGMTTEAYQDDWKQNYLRAMAKARVQWADALLAALWEAKP